MARAFRTTSVSVRLVGEVGRDKMNFDKRSISREFIRTSIMQVICSILKP